MRKSIKILVIIDIIFIIIAPFLFTRNAFVKQLNFTGTGNIGNTIGGITAPLIGIMSILLLFYTLLEQSKFNKKQVNISSDEQFKSTFFNLLQTQRDILSKISGFFEMPDKSKIIEAKGINFFKVSKHQIKLIFSSLDNSKYFNGFDIDQAHAAMESLEESLLCGSNMPEEIEVSNNRIIQERHIDIISAYVNDTYKISNEYFNAYKRRLIEKQIGLGYITFFYKYETIGYYFRHLFHILKFIKQNEDYKIGKLEKKTQTNIDKIHSEYAIYAQLVQAQMSTDELLLTFYNSFLFPQIQELIIHYNLLENLPIEYLIKPEHNCKPEFNLKSRQNILESLLSK